MYGHTIGVHYDGDDSYKTMLGGLISIGVYALMIINFVTLITMYNDGSRQDDKNSYEIYERRKSDPFNLADNGIELTLFPFDKSSSNIDLRRIGRYKLEQFLPCDSSCTEEEKSRTIYLSDCSAEKKEEMNVYYEGDGGYFE